MTTATSVRDWRDSALAENERRSREAAIRTEVLNDMDGMEQAVEGCLHFLNGGEGHRVEGLDDLRLSPGAAKFIGIA